MPSPQFPEPPPTVPATPIAEVDRAVARVHAQKDAWVKVLIPERIALLRACIDTTLEQAAPWVEAACRAKGIRAGDAQEGEEWLGGPMTVIRNLRLLIDALEQGGHPAVPRVATTASGRVVAQVFPANGLDKAMFSGITAEVWMQPGKTATQGAIYRRKETGEFPPGKVALVLGAGNVASIGPMDALYKLFVEDEVVVCKSNPVNAYLGTFWERSFRPLLERDVFAVVHGGAEVGSHLTSHPKIDTVHITGSDATHDAIVWGADAEERARAKGEHRPKLTKPITSELGCVTPLIVVPGEWSESDIAYQAKHVAAMVCNNASFNCNAAKVVVMAKGWPQREAFLSAVHEALASVPARKAYYPGAQQRYSRFVEHYPQARPLVEGGAETVPWTVIPDVPAKKGEYALTNEAFCGVLAEVSLEATTAEEFLPRAVGFCNDEVWGTLSCMMLIDGPTQKRCSEALERAVAELRYGGIGINVWAGLIYGLVVTTWGAFPGHTLEDIQSGRGVVHNTYLFDDPEKSVIRAPFRIKPTPAWFVHHRNLPALGERLTRFEAKPGWLRLPSVVTQAVRG